MESPSPTLAVFQAIILILHLAYSTESEWSSRKAKFISSLAEFESNSHEIVIVSDWKNPDHADAVVKRLGGHLSIPTILQDPSGLKQIAERYQVPFCPLIRPFKTMTKEEEEYLVDPDSIFVRQGALASSKRLPKFILVWVSSRELESVLSSLAETILWCEQKVEMGLFHNGNHIVFVADDDLQDSAGIFDTKEIQNHPMVATIKFGKNIVMVKNFNFYSGSNGLPRVIRRALEYDQSPSPSKLYYTPEKLPGFTLRVIAVPYGHYLQADFLSEEQESGPHRRLAGYEGVHVEVMGVFERALGVRVARVNAEPVFDYGRVGDNGTRTGMLGMIHHGKADLTADWAFQYDVHQTLEGVFYGPQEFISFASPKNLPTSKITAIVDPFSGTVWAAVVISLLLTPSALLLTNHFFTRGIKQMSLNLFLDAYWYCLGVLLGDMKSTTLRINMALKKWTVLGWLLFSLFLGLFYSSILRSQLIAPRILPSIDSFREAVESEMALEMSLPADMFATVLATSDNPVHKKLVRKHVKALEMRGNLYDVEEGFKIVVHWKSHLKFVTQIYHSTSSGDPLVHLSDDSLFEKSFLALSYNRNKPWGRHLAKLMSEIHSSALMERAERVTKNRLRRRHLASLARPAKGGGGVRDCHRDSSFCPLGPAHLVGTLAFASAGLLAGLCSLAAEALLGRRRKKRKKFGETVKMSEIRRHMYKRRARNNPTTSVS